jgi:biopolymer transport protein ExbB/TolQ
MIEKYTIMTYNDGAKTEQQSLLPSSLNLLAERLTVQEQMINEVANKLYRIVNRERPEKEVDRNEVSRGEVDFNSALQVQSDRLQKNNTRLEVIIKHLTEII